MKITSSTKRTPTQHGSAAKQSTVRHLADIDCDEAVRKYLNAALSDNTLRAYQGDIDHFIAWGGKIPASPTSVASYIAHYAVRLASSTLSRRLVGISRAHAAAGYPSPTNTELVRATLQGVRRQHGSAIRQVTPLSKAELLRMVKGRSGLRGVRDTALLLLGFASALRRAELVSLNVDDLRYTDEGIIIYLRRSKTDQEGVGKFIAIPHSRKRYCPVRAVQAWLRQSSITSGPLFRRVNRYGQVQPQRLTAQSVALIIKERVAAVGLDPDRFSGHSLRAGFVTNAAACGASSASIRAQTGHKSDAMMQRYIRNSQLFADNPNRKIW